MFDIDYENRIEEISTWIKNTVHTAGFTKVVIGLSGGIDSAVSAALAVKGLGAENVYVLLLPYGKLNDVATQDACSVAEHLGLTKSYIKDIRGAVDALTQDISLDETLRRGNIMARVRMIYLYDFAKEMHALVCGTENKSEYYLGYFTRFGDEASDIEPIRALYKTQVWGIAKYLQIPEEIIAKAPSAGLWEDQTDEGELGFTYKVADQILFYAKEKKLSSAEISKKGIPSDVIARVLDRVKKNDFKHKLPYLKI